MRTRERFHSSERDQLFTPFGLILERLIRSSSGALGAVFVDAEGEAVDYAGTLDAFTVKIAAAHMRILLHEAAGSPALGGETLREITFRSAERSFFIRSMPEGYAFVLLLARRAFSVSRRALQVTERRLAREAALPLAFERHETIWYAIDVECEADDHRRPLKVRLGSRWEPLETVLGTMAGLARGEHGYRVRLQSGAELTLIREPRSCWYTDEPAVEEDVPLPPSDAVSRKRKINS